MVSKFKLAYVLMVFLALVVSGCTPSREGFKRVVISDFLTDPQKIYGDYKKISDELFTYTNPRYIGLYFIVFGDIEVNHNEEYPYKATVFYISYSLENKPKNTSKFNSFANKLNNMNPNELYNECIKINSQNGGLTSSQNTLLGEPILFYRNDYTWWQKIDAWHKVE